MLLFLGYLIAVISLTHVNIINGELVVHAHYRSLKERKQPIDAHDSQSDVLLQLQQFSTITFGGELILPVTPERIDFWLFDIAVITIFFLLPCHAYHRHRRGPPYSLNC